MAAGADSTAGPVGYFQSVLAAGADPNVVIPGSGFTPLHLSALKGYAANLRELMAGGADIRATDKDGDTALAMASGMDHDAAAEALLAAHRRPPNGVFGPLDKKGGLFGSQWQARWFAAVAFRGDVRVHWAAAEDTPEDSGSGVLQESSAEGNQLNITVRLDQNGASKAMKLRATSAQDADRWATQLARLSAPA